MNIEIPGSDAVITEAMLRNLSDIELMGYCTHSTDPIIKSLTKRLQLSHDEIEEMTPEWDGETERREE